MWRHKRVAISNLLTFLNILCVIMINLLTFHYIFNRYFTNWCEKGEDPEPGDQIIYESRRIRIRNTGHGSGTLFWRLIFVFCYVDRQRKNSQQSNPTDSDPVSYEFSADSLLSDSDKVDLYIFTNQGSLLLVTFKMFKYIDGAWTSWQSLPFYIPCFYPTKN